MDTQRAVELQVVLEGVELPASRDALVAYARAYDETAAAALAQLPDRSYERLNDVGEALLAVQPRREANVPGIAVESDRPPGGDDYLRPEPASGAVRSDAPEDNPPQRALEQQTRTLSRQQEKQEQSR